MTENDFFAFVIAAIEQGFAAMGIVGVTVAQDFQPTLQGAPSGPSVNLHVISEKRYGFLERSDKFENNQNIHTETQLMIVTLQINAHVQVDYNTPQWNPQGLTARDYLNAAISILQSDYTRWWLRSNGIAVERVTDIRVTHFKNEKERYEVDPSCDCNFEYNSVITTITPSAVKIVEKIIAV